MNTVYNIKESRSYWRAQGAALLIGALLSLLLTSILAVLLATSVFARDILLHVAHRVLADPAALLIRVLGWAAAICVLNLVFAVMLLLGTRF